MACHPPSGNGVRTGLTLNLGLRYEPGTILTEKNGHISTLMDFLNTKSIADLKIGNPSQADRTYREIGIPDAHHPLTHHQNDPDKISKVIRINTFHTELLAYFLNKLHSAREGDGSLLDRTMLLYGGGISDGNAHLHSNLPVVLLGGGSEPINGGRHLKYPAGTPMANLFVALLERLGMPQEPFGDSNGKLDLLRRA
jgi:hypothetical protein